MLHFECETVCTVLKSEKSSLAPIAVRMDPPNDPADADEAFQQADPAVPGLFQQYLLSICPPILLLVGQEQLLEDALHRADHAAAIHRFLNDTSSSALYLEVSQDSSENPTSKWLLSNAEFR